VVAAVPRNVFGIGIECCRPARVEGSWRTGKGEGVLGRAAVGGVTKVESPLDAITETVWYNLV